MTKVLMIGSESLGVRGLSCFIEHRGTKVLIDPGVALGFTRWGLHPHPIQAVAGDEVRKKISMLWKQADYVVLTHMHGDHIPLYNANPFQLSLYQLENNGRVKIIAPDPAMLRGIGRTRLEKIREVYGVNLITLGNGGFEIGPIRIYGSYSHGMSSRTKTYAALVELGEKVMHLSDTELLCDKVIDLALKVKPNIIITDGPPIYRFLHDRQFINELLNKASKNLRRLSEVAHTVVVDHHINRCDEGYRWIREEARRSENAAITTAAEYMKTNPKLLEAWRRTLYRYYPVSNKWFEKSYDAILEEYRPIYHEVTTKINNYERVSEATLAKLLKSFK